MGPALGESGERRRGRSPFRRRIRFEHRHEAEAFLAALRERFARFGLELHPHKTRLIPFRRTAGRDGGKKPPTFNFLGFAHSCGKTRKGHFTVLRQTMRQRWQAKLSEVKAELRRHLHSPVPELGAYLAAVVRGHVRYYGVPMNGTAIGAFRMAIGRLWWRAVARRSQTAQVPWQRTQRLVIRWLPPAHICHPYPLARFAATTHGQSRMRQCRSSGSVEEVMSNHDSYSDSSPRRAPRRTLASRSCTWATGAADTSVRTAESRSGVDCSRSRV